jgi:hypothetical protein
MWCLVRTCFLVHRKSSFLLCPHIAEGANEVSSTRALIPCRRTLLSRPNHLPYALPPNTITWGWNVKILTCEFWRNTSTQTVAPTNLKPRVPQSPGPQACPEGFPFLDSVSAHWALLESPGPPGSPFAWGDPMQVMAWSPQPFAGDFLFIVWIM